VEDTGEDVNINFVLLQTKTQKMTRKGHFGEDTKNVPSKAIEFFFSRLLKKKNLLE
jgi:hypothetical protein